MTAALSHSSLHAPASESSPHTSSPPQVAPTQGRDATFWSLVGGERTERRALGWMTLASGVLALASMGVGLHAAQYDFEAFSDPMHLLDMAHVDLSSVRAFMLLDMFGYYLLLAPIVLASHRFLARQTPWASLWTACGLAYVLIGAIGAAILAAAWPSILAAHAVATPAEALLLRSNFALLTQLVYDGLWNMLEVLLAGGWWLGLGTALWHQHRRLAVLTLLSGAFPLLDGVAGIFALQGLHDAMLSGYLVTGIVWPVVIGLLLLTSQVSGVSRAQVELGVAVRGEWDEGVRPCGRSRRTMKRLPGRPRSGARAKILRGCRWHRARVLKASRKSARAVAAAALARNLRAVVFTVVA